MIHTLIVAWLLLALFGAAVGMMSEKGGGGCGCLLLIVFLVALFLVL